MLVKYVMDRHFVMVREDATLEDIFILVRRYHVSDFPVIDAESNFKGMLYEHDLLRALYPKMSVWDTGFPSFAAMEENAGSLKDNSIESLMTRQALAISIDDPILKAGSDMLRNNVTKAPVIKDGKVVGVLTQEMIFTQVMGRIVSKLTTLEDVEVVSQVSEDRSKDADKSNKRLFPRVNLDRTLAYKRTETGLPDDRKGALAKLVNISAGGLLISAKEELPRGTLLDVAFDLYKNDRPIKRLCRVVRCSRFQRSGFYDVGLMFLAISPAEQEKINHYLSQIAE